MARQKQIKTHTKVWLCCIAIALLCHFIVIFLIGISNSFPKDKKSEKYEISLLSNKKKPGAKQKIQNKEKKELKKTAKKKSQKIKRQKKQPEPQPASEAPPPPTKEPLELNTKASIPAAPSRLKLNMSWSGFHQTFGPEIEKQRQIYTSNLLNRKSRSLGLGEMSGKVKKALRSNKSFSQVGNNQVLGKKLSHFRSYIEIIHDKIHANFANGFLSSLNLLAPDHPLNDFSLKAVLEFEILPSGIISEVRLIKTSGLGAFDAEAIDSVYRSSPHRPPPSSIYSWNNKVYMKWGFYRNNRKCGVFNAQPFIINSPGKQKRELTDDDLMVDDS